MVFKRILCPLLRKVDWRHGTWVSNYQLNMILNTGIPKSIVHEPDLRIVEKNHEEQIDDFNTRIDSFFNERISSIGPWIIVMHGHVIETLMLKKLNAPYELVEKDNHTLGIPGIWGIANGSISTIIDNNFIFFNYVP